MIRKNELWHNMKYKLLFIIILKNVTNVMGCHIFCVAKLQKCCDKYTIRKKEF
jgi:hypothetical protein